METIGGKTVLTTVAEQANPRHTALLVIDIQDHPELWSSPASRQVLDNAGKLVAAARTAAVRTVYLHNVWAPDYRNISAAYLAGAIHLGGYDPATPPGHSILDGQPGSRLHPDLEPGPADTVIPNCRASSFAGTGLDQLLRSSGIRTVVCIGHATDACVANTVWAAVNLDYYVIPVADAVCGGRIASGPDGDPTLALFGYWLHVPDTAELVRTWLQAAAVAATAANEGDGA